MAFWILFAAAAGYICIVYIMFGGARRLEIGQNRNYGSDPEYQAICEEDPYFAAAGAVI